LTAWRRLDSYFAAHGEGQARPSVPSISRERKTLEQLKGYEMTPVEPDRAAFRAAMRPLYEKYDSMRTKELREKIQSFK
jgi:TRAP-type C4-dicarboxylate transport system substrate-binding protein